MLHWDRIFVKGFRVRKRGILLINVREGKIDGACSRWLLVKLLQTLPRPAKARRGMAN